VKEETNDANFVGYGWSEATNATAYRYRYLVESKVEVLLSSPALLLVELLVEEMEWVGVVSLSSSLILENWFAAVVLAAQLLVAQNLVRLANIVKELLGLLLLVLRHLVRVPLAREKERVSERLREGEIKRETWRIVSRTILAPPTWSAKVRYAFLISFWDAVRDTPIIL
jgi:hypothetical protein